MAGVEQNIIQKKYVTLPCASQFARDQIRNNVPYFE